MKYVLLPDVRDETMIFCGPFQYLDLFSAATVETGRDDVIWSKSGPACIISDRDTWPSLAALQENHRTVGTQISEKDAKVGFASPKAKFATDFSLATSP